MQRDQGCTTSICFLGWADGARTLNLRCDRPSNDFTLFRLFRKSLSYLGKKPFDFLSVSCYLMVSPPVVSYVEARLTTWLDLDESVSLLGWPLARRPSGSGDFPSDRTTGLGIRADSPWRLLLHSDCGPEAGLRSGGVSAPEGASWLEAVLAQDTLVSVER